MSRILKSVFRAYAFSPFAGDFFIRIVININSVEAVFAAAQAPIGFPHAVTRCFISPKEPTVICLIKRVEAVFPGCFLMGIKLAHHHRNIGVNKFSKPCEKIKNEVELGRFIKDIYNIDKYNGEYLIDNLATDHRYNLRKAPLGFIITSYGNKFPISKKYVDVVKNMPDELFAKDIKKESLVKKRKR